MNRIQLIGRLGRDPEGGQGATGAYAGFSLATHEHWMDRSAGETVEHTEWHRLVCFDRLADIALEFLVKGSEVYVEGPVRSTRWTDREGREQRRTEVRVEVLRMLRRAPTADPIVLAAQGIASLEKLLQDAGAGLRADVSMADVARMLRLIRTGLVSGDVDATGPAAGDGPPLPAHRRGA